MPLTVNKEHLVGLTCDEIAEALRSLAIDEKYACRLTYWVYRKRIVQVDEMTGISQEVKRSISKKLVTGINPPSKRVESSDGSARYLFHYSSERVVEAVFLPDKNRNTICVSTQCGCARACRYCRTGEMGLRGNLTAGEIVNQVLAVPESGSINRVVFMGMGEPLDNTDEVIKAINILTAEWGLAIGSANITVSTVGIIPGIRRLLEETRCNLTLSLVSPVAGERVILVPAEKIYPAAEIIELMKNAPPSGKRRFTIAYMMIDGVNDTDDHLESLINLLRSSSLRVNLLKYHPHGDNPFRPSSDERIRNFREKLLASGISASIRRSRGEDISAACGLLAAGNAEDTD